MAVTLNKKVAIGTVPRDYVAKTLKDVKVEYKSMLLIERTHCTKLQATLLSISGKPQTPYIHPRT